MKTRICELLFPLGIPLPWRQLLSQRKRFATAVAGVVFAVTLMMFQLGIYHGILEKVISPHRALDGQLVMTSRDYNNLYSNTWFTIRRLSQALEHPGVESAVPLYVDSVMLRNPETLQSKRIAVFGVRPTENPFRLPELEAGMELLKDDESALFDAASQPEFGPIEKLLKQNAEVRTEAAGKSLRIRGLFRMGGTISSSGHLIAGERAFHRLTKGHSLQLASVGVIKVRPGWDASAVASDLNRLLSNDVRVVQMRLFAGEEQDYWNKRSPIAFIFLGTMLVAMVVGAVIVYQILYTDVTDHLHEYATLKAIGYDDFFFRRLVLQEALILLVFGFIPGLVLTEALFALTRYRAAMPVGLSAAQSGIVFTLALLMCSLAGMLALRRLRSADPAEVF